MQVSDAVNLISSAFVNNNQAEIWADLGSGSGIFTLALSELLPAGSIIYAVDQHTQTIPAINNKIVINFIHANFEKDKIQVNQPDGILMANSLHYVSDKSIFLKNLLSRFISIRKFILIEYDNMQSSPWVPYPVDLKLIETLFSDFGFNAPVKTGELKSIYRSGNIYSCYFDRSN